MSKKKRTRKKPKQNKDAKVVPIRDGLTSLYNAMGTGGLANPYTGMGGPNTKSAGNYFTRSVLNEYEQWEAAYESNWIARRVVDVLADDCTSNWRTIKTEHAEEIHREENKLGVQSSVNEAERWSNLYGGAGVLMLTGQDLSKPLNLEKIKKGDLERLVVVDRWSLAPGEYNLYNILDASFLRPEFYTLAYASSSPRIHYSHFALFYGDPLPIRLLQQTNGWGDSILRRGIDQIKQLLASINGIAELMQEANVDLLRMAGFNTGITSEQEGNILKRIELFRQAKSNFKISAMDSDDEYVRNTLNLAGVDSSIQMLMTQVCGAYSIPMTRLFGTSARGMNATGEGDRRDYYDMISSKQRGAIAKSMESLDQVLVRSATGSFPDSFDYTWNPLEANDDEKVSNAEHLRAQKHVLLYQADLISKYAVQKELQASEEYQINDKDIEEQESLEDTELFSETSDPG